MVLGPSAQEEDGALLDTLAGLTSASPADRNESASALVAAAGLKGANAARFLMAHLADALELTQPCAEAIAASPEREALCRELMNHLPAASAKVACLARVCALAAPEHPLAAPGCWRAVPTFALYAGEGRWASTLDGDTSLAAVAGNTLILAAAEAPLSRWTVVESVERQGGSLRLRMASEVLKDHTGLLLSSYLFWRSREA